MGKMRHRKTKRLVQLHLHCGIADMVLAADDMGDVQFAIIHHRRQRIHRPYCLIGAILAQKQVEWFRTNEAFKVTITSLLKAAQEFNEDTRENYYKPIKEAQQSFHTLMATLAQMS